jgi:hypothetical protein
MWTIIAGIFFMAHGIVHLLYAGQSRRYFELKPGMIWPDGSWAFSKLIGDEPTRLLAAVLLALTALSFIIAGAALLFRQEWWRPTVIVSAAFSTVIFFLFWDGKVQVLDEKGLVGVFINIVIFAFIIFSKHNT